MNKIVKSLVGNTLIFAIGNGATMIISFFMIPLYTSVLSTSDYGISDLVITTTNMLLPLISLQIFSAVFRWLLDNEEKEEEKEVFTNGFTITLLGCLVIAIFGGILSIFFLKFAIITSINLMAVLFLNLFQNFVRGLNRVKLYSLSGVIASAVNVLSNILLMFVFKLGLNGFLISLVLSNFSTVLFLLFFGRIYQFLDFSLISKSKIFEMLRYSIPMIPNSFTWWLTNDASRIIILAFVGPAGNGLYAIANKIPTLIATIFGLFQNAWQISAVEISREKDADKIYSIVFNMVLALLLFGSSAIVSIIKTFMAFYVANSYFDAWKFIPILLLTAVFSNISAFLGTTYLVKKKTKGLFSTTIWGTVINLVLSFTLIPIFGIQGAGLSGALGFLLVSILRFKQTSKWIEIKIDWPVQLVLIAGYLVMSTIEYLASEMIIFKAMLLLAMLLIILFYMKKLRFKKVG